MSLREEIMYIVGDFLIDHSLTAEQRAEKILNLFEKRIDSRLNELKSGMDDKKLKNILPEEKWKRYYEKLEQSSDELEMLKKEILK